YNYSATSDANGEMTIAIPDYSYVYNGVLTPPSGSQLVQTTVDLTGVDHDQTITVPMQSGSMVSGVVRGRAGDPVTGATVRLSSNTGAGSASVTTGTDGRYSLVVANGMSSLAVYGSRPANIDASILADHYEYDASYDVEGTTTQDLTLPAHTVTIKTLG